MATLINGNGNPAVYAGQDADLYAGTIGAATRILNVGSKFAATIEDANTIAIADGVIVTKEGRRIQLDVGSIDEFLIPTGQAGTTRYYIIGYHLYTDGSANQLCETFVQLMNTSTETITENTFRGGFNEVYVSLYRVTQNGLTLNTPAALLSVSETIAQLRDKVNPAMQDILWYGTCATAAATQAKVATTTDRKLTNLTAGQKVAIKMTYNNTHASPTLNVDGKGAKSIKAYGTTAPKVWWKAGDVVTFVYDGTNWLMGVTAGEIEQINSDLTELSTYVYCGTAKYNETINLPNGWTELDIMIYYQSRYCTLHIYRRMVDSVARVFTAGYYRSSNDYMGCLLNISLSSIVVSSINYCGTEATPTTNAAAVAYAKVY